MAPLKQGRCVWVRRLFELYPWLKGHGSIEAWARGQTLLPEKKYPWLKGHGSIEALEELLYDCEDDKRIHG